MTDERRTRTVTMANRHRAGGVIVEVLSGQGVAARHVLGEQALVAGSDAAVDIVIREATVSRRHASFELKRGGVGMKDLGSRNGTWYLGARVTDATVPLGATVRLGKTLVRFVAADAAPAGPRIEGLIGSSVALEEHRAQLQRAAAVEASVLLRGETGTGKEMAARAIHLASSRRAAPFIVFDGGTSSTELLDSQLFGHRRGAFTGATENRAGAGINAGDALDVAIEIDTEPREVVVPEDLMAALDAEPAAKQAFKKLSYSNKRLHVLSVEDAKTPETRQRRVEKVITTLRGGK